MPVSNTERLDRARRVARSIGLLNLYSAGVHHLNKRNTAETFGLSNLEAQNIQVATGHFTYEDIAEGVTGFPRTTVLRDPLARARSHYAHWQEARGNMWWHDGSVPYGDKVSFEDFATDLAIANYQTKRMGGLGFAIIGTSDNLPGFFEEIGIDLERTIPRLNPGKYRDVPNLDPGFMRDFTELNAADYVLYESVIQKSD
jgi:hypothetical protein